MLRNVVFCLISIALSKVSLGQQRNFQQEASRLSKVLNEKHVQPRAWNNQLSVDIFNLLLQEADPDKIYFSQKDLLWFEPFRELLDDEINGKAPWVFLNRFRERYQSSLVNAKANFQAFSSDELLSNSGETFVTSPSGFAPDNEALRNRQRLFLKANIFNRITLLASRDSVPCEVIVKERALEIVDRARKSQVGSIDRTFNSKDTFTEKVGGMFLRALTAVFDPHTFYMSSSEMQKFVGSLATEDFYFGFTLAENERGEITIASLMPGGPAWRSGQMHINDILVSIESESGDAFEFTEVDLNEAYDLVDAVQSGTARFTLRKPDGVLKTVELTKAKLEVEENFVRSYILSGDKKIGYIHLPDFYTTWGASNEGSRCANDVAKEIIKLKGDDIEGLILDLRYNGGGSLYEAMEMAGIFIDEGALGQLKDRERTMTLKDVNRGTVYDGPLVILVNGMSASASEFVAAAIQDYNRGLIVGSRTYGKATGQTIIPVNGEMTGSNVSELVNNSNGFIKITIERLYRVTGKSLQGRGIQPDVSIPDLMQKLNIRESANPFTLLPDSTDRKTYFKPLPVFEVAEVKKRSLGRIGANSDFKRMMSVDIAAIVDADEIRLDLKSLCQTESPSMVMEGSAVAVPFQVSNNSFDVLRFKVDQYADAYNQSWFDRLREDIGLHETYSIINDFINLKKP